MCIETIESAVSSILSSSGVSVGMTLQNYNPNEKDEWRRIAAHWTVAIKSKSGRSQTFDYWLGSGNWTWRNSSRGYLPAGAIAIGGRTRTPAECLSSTSPYFSDKEAIIQRCTCSPPRIAEVLDCIIGDGGACDCTFEEWASDFGFDPDSRSAEKIYRQCQTNYQRLLSCISRDTIDAIRSAIEQGGGI